MSTLFDLSDEPKMSTTAVVPWFGCNRLLGHTVGEELRGCKWIGIPFSGAMPELAQIKASTIIVNDLHRHVINLAAVAGCPRLGPKLYRQLRRLPFHPEVLAAAQLASEYNEGLSRESWLAMSDDEKTGVAVSYFVSQWMGRSGKGGTDNEFSGKLPVRWNANGGDSNTRYRSAVKSLIAWRRVLERCNFSTLDAFEFLDTVNDEPRHGIYCDPPFPDKGEEYKHKFTEAQQRQLALCLFQFKQTRVVCRFYDHPLIRELYPASHWTWRFQRGRDQANQAKPEVLLINGPSYGEGN